MRSVNVVLLLALISMLFVGCANRKNISPVPTISKEAKADLSRPVNCATAKSDITMLESERASTAKQILSGVRMVMPISAVAGILMGDYGDRAQVTTGAYNHDIENKIDQIKSTCKVG